MELPATLTAPTPADRTLPLLHPFTPMTDLTSIPQTPQPSEHDRALDAHNAALTHEDDCRTRFSQEAAAFKLHLSHH
jgi:hypothetical protein